MKRVWVDSKRRVVKRIKTPLPISELYAYSYNIGMTVNEYVQYQNSLNADNSKRRNRSSTYDMGPIPYRKEKEDDA